MAALVFNAVWRDSAFAMIFAARGAEEHPAAASTRPPGSTAPARVYRFRRITLPLMRLPILIAVVRLLIHFVNVLTFALILTGGGPERRDADDWACLYRLGFIDFRIGEANALAVLVFLFNLVLVACNCCLFRQRRGAAR